MTFTVNGRRDISFNPTDSAFVERLFSAFDRLDKKQEAYREEIETLSDKKAVFEVARCRDAEMRALIDEVFCDTICADIFGDMNVYALADGLPVWCNFLLAVMDEVDTAFAREQKMTNPRIRKYTAKYRN